MRRLIRRLPQAVMHRQRAVRRSELLQSRVPDHEVLRLFGRDAQPFGVEFHRHRNTFGLRTTLVGFGGETNEDILETKKKHHSASSQPLRNASIARVRDSTDPTEIDRERLDVRERVNQTELVALVILHALLSWWHQARLDDLQMLRTIRMRWRLRELLEAGIGGCEERRDARSVEHLCLQRQCGLLDMVMRLEDGDGVVQQRWMARHRGADGSRRRGSGLGGARHHEAREEEQTEQTTTIWKERTATVSS